jgi:DNA gyrase subunit B
VQTNEEMKTQLLERGLNDSELDLSGGTGVSPVKGEAPLVVRGEKMQRLASLLAGMEEALLALERRGYSLKSHATRRGADGKLPVFHVFLGRAEHWFTSRSELDAFLEQQEAAGGPELSISDAPVEARSVSEGEKPTRSVSEDMEARSVSEGAEDASANGQPRASQLHITELHEVRTINQGLADLKSQFGFDSDMLIRQERTGSDQPRYVLRRGEHDVPLEDLRGLAAAVREMGQKGLTVTRFKGLGEMNAEELRETTLDPANRTLVKVLMNDAGAADDMFRVLMGDKVEPRREFIEKHALEVRNLDV